MTLCERLQAVQCLSATNVTTENQNTSLHVKVLLFNVLLAENPESKNTRKPPD